MQALRMKTVDAAHVIGLDDLVGSIEAGKFADLTVLSEDLLACPVDDIRSIEVKGTVLGGRVIARGAMKPDWKLSGAPEIPPGFWPGVLWLFEVSSAPNSWARWLFAQLSKLIV